MGHREVVASARSDVAVGVQNRTSFRDRDLSELHGARPTALDESRSARRTDVPHPFRALPKHRDDIAVPVMPRDNKDVGAEAATAPASYLHREENAGVRPSPDNQAQNLFTSLPRRVGRQSR